MRVMHLTSSRFFGGPERQMLGLAHALQGRVETCFALFREDGCNSDFLTRIQAAGFEAACLRHDSPRLLAAFREVSDRLGSGVDVLFCHGYKAGLVGWAAARSRGIPVVAVSRGWTGENRKVRFYERIDRRMLPRMDRVICVSRAQAEKVRAAGVKQESTRVIYNSIDAERFRQPIADGRRQLAAHFPEPLRNCLRKIVVAAGRLSPEKGFDVLLEAARRVAASRGDVGFAIFGEGAERSRLELRIAAARLAERVVLAGFTPRFDELLPHCDLFVQSSFSEGLPNVLLEALAARVPVLATRVGGTSELLGDGAYGALVDAGNPSSLANAMCEVLEDSELARRRRDDGEAWIRKRFTFARQAAEYQQVIAEVLLGASA